MTTLKRRKEMQCILAIDPGAKGGFAWRDKDGIIQALSMPEGMADQADSLRNIVAENSGITAIIERTGTYIPGNSGVAAATFARHCGHLEAILYCFGIPAEQVAPQVWQKSLGALPKDKKQRKSAVKELMARKYPHLSVNLTTADALGILTWIEAK